QLPNQTPRATRESGEAAAGSAATRRPPDSTKAARPQAARFVSEHSSRTRHHGQRGSRAKPPQGAQRPGGRPTARKQRGRRPRDSCRSTAPEPDTTGNAGVGRSRRRERSDQAAARQHESSEAAGRAIRVGAQLPNQTPQATRESGEAAAGSAATRRPPDITKAARPKA